MNGDLLLLLGRDELAEIGVFDPRIRDSLVRGVKELRQQAGEMGGVGAGDSQISVETALQVVISSSNWRAS